eukprot:TRINITY_DN5166_c0_g1_i2.p1 TRINITY_DN5166_c0_g1~~TRINITY_DN5166_c0_g1_i2.p1  ORF type:complete len:168 (-),score=28.83 TRINITY_DN5166_c0_g1_i2:164-667(-)
MYCKEFAKKFNLLNPPKKIDFIDAFVVVLCDRNDQPGWSVEKFMEGHYRKHNNNYGYVSGKGRNTPQAFSHWTYESSNRKFLVCDIQGVGDLYTDPQIHTTEDLPVLGKGNLGREGFKKFIETHKCNAICKYLRLSMIHEKEMDFGTIPSQPLVPIELIGEPITLPD